MVKWAPRNIPFERRVQTACVIITMLMPIALAFSNILFLIFPILWIPYIIYLLWFVFLNREASKNPRRTIPFIRRLPYFRHFRNFFPSDIIKTTELDPSKTYLFALHPHGIIGLSAQANFGNDYSDFQNLFPGIKLRVATLASNFKIPIAREYILSLGYIDASKNTIVSYLENHYSVMIVIGGAQEALHARPGSTTLILRNRKGFVRLALQAGSCLVPVYAFGENELYDQIPNPKGSLLRKIQDWERETFGWTLPLFHGRGIWNYNLGFLPYRVPLTTVIGRPIELPHIENPTDSEVDEWHSKYMQALEELFDEWKDKVNTSPKESLKYAD